MKRQISLTAALLVLILVLSACGNGTKKENQTDSSDGPITDSAVNDPTDAVDPADQAPSRQEDGMLAGGSPTDRDANAGGETRQEGQTSADSDASRSDPDTRDDDGGVPLDQMLRNARVHDRDGDLLDLENSVTPSADRW